MVFVRHCQFYAGNISEPITFKDLIVSISKQMGETFDKPLVVMDAGISTEENLDILKSGEYNYDYVCVSRSKPNEYTN